MASVATDRVGLASRTSGVLRRTLRFPRPWFDFRPSDRPVVRRGTDYEGWWFEQVDSLQGSPVVLAGAREDISFGVGLAAEFGARVLIVDPTPRVVAHVSAVFLRFGPTSSAGFVTGVRQSPDAYDLSQVRLDQIRLLPFALWNQDVALQFYPPLHPQHVSQSIDDWRRNRSAESPPSLRVEGRRLATLLNTAELEQIELLKLDIEDAEIQVLHDILDTGLHPCQIFVEFDQLQQPNPAHHDRVRGALRSLTRLVYRLMRREQFNYSFRR